MKSVKICLFDNRIIHIEFQSYCVGEALSKESYLNISRIIEIAKLSKSDAIHPGYGFLSENADFAESVEKAGIIFIGPTRYFDYLKSVSWTYIA